MKKSGKGSPELRAQLPTITTDPEFIQLHFNSR